MQYENEISRFFRTIYESGGRGGGILEQLTDDVIGFLTIVRISLHESRALAVDLHYNKQIRARLPN